MTLWKLDASQLLDAFKSCDTTPTVAVTLMLARIEALDPKLGAFTSMNEAALEEAEAASDRWAKGKPKEPLDGLPIIVKDNLKTKGLPAAWGNAVLAKRIADRDEAPIARLRDAGAIFLGKGNTPEFAVEGYTDNLTFGVTRNPYDLKLTPGGSSGGVVAAVAAGLCFAGIGTDGGGSIRRPAGYTGLFGLKTGIGHIARSGGLPQILFDMETVGPIARSASDIKLLDGVMSGQLSLKGEPVSPPSELHILAVKTFDDSPCDAGIREAFERTCQHMQNLGHKVTQGSLPLDLNSLNEIWPQIAQIGLSVLFNNDPEIGASAHPKYQAMAEAGKEFCEADIRRMKDVVHHLRQMAKAIFDQVDMILTPTAAAQPWPALDPFPEQIDNVPVGPRGHAIFTGWVNAAGLPAMAFPVPSKGLPIGMQLVGPMGSEAALTTLCGDCAVTPRWPALATIADD